ncbi:hypothetical protein VST7929_00952 [Vibrio stylophorae]|uniref:Uncharacterized protein n=1 Tax=Vibrio stylophorae TaxID=659351 RepID=A0ABN8DWG5_9VIBR|nr:hypothetical protein VST7929_00952 [Vibrio stylophorae]
MSHIFIVCFILNGDIDSDFFAQAKKSNSPLGEIGSG